MSLARPPALVVRLEQGLRDRAEELGRAGIRTEQATDRSQFGGGQAILVDGDVLVGGSDSRKDGYAAGF